MNKNVLLTLIITILVIALVVVIIIFKGNNNKQLALTYKTNGGVPFKWEYEIEDPSIIEFVKSYQIENQNKNSKIVGGAIKTNYVFKGLKPGKTTITFRYVSIVDGRISKEEINSVEVDQNNNIKLITTEND